MRFVVLALAASLSAIAVASCGQGGTGVGTAPPPPPDCPEAGVPSGACSQLQVCAYPLCTSPSCPPTETIAYCSGAPGGSWVVSKAGDGGTFSDAMIPEISVDSGDADGDAVDGEVGDAVAETETEAEAASDTAGDSTDSAIADTADTD